MVAIAFVALTIVFSVSQASERDHQTINDVRDDQLGKGIAIGVLATCGVRSLYYGVKEKRWTWCGEPKPKPDLPKPGPALNDVTPDRPVGVKLYQ